MKEQVDSAIRGTNYSVRTQQAYTLWIRRFVLFHNRKDPRHHGRTEIDEFLTYLREHCKLSASTLNQAFYAIMFLYSKVLHLPASDPDQGKRLTRRRGCRLSFHMMEPCVHVKKAGSILLMRIMPSRASHQDP